jgi:hypothetical protein
MLRLKTSKQKEIYKKGRSFLFLPFFICVSCASSDLSKYGRVTLHSTADRNSFIFSVTDDFLDKNQDSPPDKTNPKISEVESNLLSKLLRQKKYCLGKYSGPSFIINSRQEKIFDMTFAHLIEQNYKARPISPRTYFGECKP